MFASQSGHVDVVKILLDNGAQVDLQRNKISMLRITCQEKPDDLIRLIQSESKSDSNNKYSPIILQGNKNYQPVKVHMHDGSQLHLMDVDPVVMVTSHKGHEEVEMILQDKNCKYHLHKQDDPVPFIITTKDKFLNKLISQTAELCQTDGLTALMLASGMGHNKVYKLLLDYGAEANLQTESGWFALMFASEFGHSQRYVTLLI